MPAAPGGDDADPEIFPHGRDCPDLGLARAQRPHRRIFPDGIGRGHPDGDERDASHGRAKAAAGRGGPGRGGHSAAGPGQICRLFPPFQPVRPQPASAAVRAQLRPFRRWAGAKKTHSCDFSIRHTPVLLIPPGANSIRAWNLRRRFLDGGIRPCGFFCISQLWRRSAPWGLFRLRQTKSASRIAICERARADGPPLFWRLFPRHSVEAIPIV
jgi:hypothetical protein